MTNKAEIEFGYRTAFKRGLKEGALYRQQRYGKCHGVYPSNPYHVSDPRCDVFNKGYEEAVNGT